MRIRKNITAFCTMSLLTFPAFADSIIGGGGCGPIKEAYETTISCVFESGETLDIDFTQGLRSCHAFNGKKPLITREDVLTSSMTIAGNQVTTNAESKKSVSTPNFNFYYVDLCNDEPCTETSVRFLVGYNQLFGKAGLLSAMDMNGTFGKEGAFTFNCQGQSRLL